MNAEKRIPFLAPTGMNNSLVSVRPRGGVQFHSSGGPGSGILTFGDILPWCIKEGIEFPALVRIDFALSSGRIYGQYFENGLGVPISSLGSSQAGGKHLDIYIEKPGRGAALMIGVTEAPAVGEITTIVIAPRSLMDLAEYKRIRAASFPHWYYSCDLGHGVNCSATLPDPKNAAAAAGNNLKVMLWMIEKYIGSIEGMKVLDVACSAGFHSFELARRGAIVTGIDWDSAAIAQAKFIQECIADELRYTVDFRHTDLYAFKAPQKSFDLVYCSGLFYHLQDPIGAARRLASLCVRGAVIQSCVTCREGDLFELSDSSKFPFCASWEFALVPTPSMLRRLFENAGFKTEDIFDLAEFSINGEAVSQQRPAVDRTPSGPAYLFLTPQSEQGEVRALAPDDKTDENLGRLAGAVKLLRRVLTRCKAARRFFRALANRLGIV